jgi:tetrahydromethanopterin S-methyltransferase subunit C
MPALAELRKACAEQLRTEQLEGTVRPDIDPLTVANGIVAIMLSLLMSLVQIGGDAATLYGDEIAAVLEAAIRTTPPASRGG